MCTSPKAQVWSGYSSVGHVTNTNLSHAVLSKSGLSTKFVTAVQIGTYMEERNRWSMIAQTVLR